MTKETIAERDEIIIKVARLIWNSGLNIGEFYSVIGVDLDDMRCDHAHDVVTEIAGIFKGWENTPEE